MELKRVSFEVAKAIKEAGYPQDGCDEYLNKYGAIDAYLGYNTARPLAMEVWLWLCKKGIVFYPCMHSAHEPSGYSCFYRDNNRVLDLADFGIQNDPEEAIIAAIEYLVDNNLIK